MQEIWKTRDDEREMKDELLRMLSIYMNIRVVELESEGLICALYRRALCFLPAYGLWAAN